MRNSSSRAAVRADKRLFAFPCSHSHFSCPKLTFPFFIKQNKTNSAVQLRHIPTGIVVKCQATRSRESNRKEARKLLAQRIDEHFNGDQARSVVVGQTKKKRADSAAKKSRRKYKKLAEEANNKEAGAGEEEVEAQAEDGDGQEAEKITEKRQLEVTREEEDMEVETRIEKKNQDPPPKT